MSDGWRVAGWAWSDGARVAANLVIVAAGVSAARALRATPARFRRPAPAAVPSRPDPPRPDDGPAPTPTEIRLFEMMFLNDTWLIDKADARRELRDNRDDLEARPCRT